MTATPRALTDTPNPPVPSADLIGDVLRHVRLTGSVFLRGEFRSPWAYRTTDAAALAAVVHPGADRLVLFHVVTQGEVSIELVTGESATARAGDALVMPYSDMHTVGFPKGAPEVPITELLPMPPWNEMPVVRIDGGGEPAAILCGYLHCDDLFFSPVLGALPRLLHVRAATDAAAAWRAASFNYMVDHSGLGPDDPLGRLPELVLADCLKQYAMTLPAESSGWLAAVREPVLSATLHLMHARPAHRWTVPALAREVAVSRSVLAQRFRDTLGVSPMKYLANWRLQLATDLLRSTDEGISALAARVGYDSVEAFSRAFRRRTGSTPGAWRARQAASTSRSSRA